MKREKIKAFVSAAVISVSAITMLCTVSCTENQGTDRLSAFLYSPEYSAEFDFILDGSEEALSGSASAVKKENVCLTFSSPDAFEGLSVESGENGESDTLMFGYYGMKAPLPKGALTKINLILSFFSDETASALSSLPRGAVVDCELPDGDFADTVVPKSCVFETNGGNTVCTLIFDAASGLPMQYKAESEGMCATMMFTGIKYPE